jgi:serine/threonine protein kinase
MVLWLSSGTLRELLKSFSKNSPNSPHPRALQWSLESCKGLAFLHKHKVIHGDIGCQNILVGTDGHAKLCDFAGSMIGDKQAWVAYEIRSQHPLYFGQQPTIATEKKFRAGEFPLDRVNGLGIKKVIGKCWQGSYHGVSAICEDIEAIERSGQF